MAKKKSNVPASLKPAAGTKPTTTKKVTAIDSEDTRTPAQIAGSSPARDYFPMESSTPRKPGDDVDWEDIDGPILTRKFPDSWRACPINGALAEGMIFEKTNCGPDDITVILTYLSYSPAFRLMVKEYRAALALSAEPDNQDWETTLFAARLYWAGLRSGREEALQKKGGAQ